MQRDGTGKRLMLEARDLARPLGGDLTPLDAVVEVAKSDCPDEWSRYCDLAHQLVQRKKPTEISQEEAGRHLLAAISKRLRQKYGPVRWNNMATPTTEFEIIEAEAQKLEGQFRDQLLLALQEGRYSLIAFDDHLKEVTVPLALIKPGCFRFESEEMEVNGIMLIGVRFVPAQAIPAYQNDPRGRKPGEQPAKGLIFSIALSILNDKAQRPPPGHGRKAALARMVDTRLRENGKIYKENTIARLMRDSVKEWEAKNPDE